jgi:hypothetical protein
MLVRNPALRRAIAPAVAAVLVAVLASSAGALCPRVTFVDMGDKQFSIGWTLGIDERDILDFGGYRVWVRQAWVDTLSLAKSYVWGETDTAAAGFWSFEPFYQDSIRVFTSQDAQNAFPYQLSVTAFNASAPGVNLAERACREANTTALLYPGEDVTNNLKKIQVIPNPYRSSADWEYGGQRRVVFVGLPGQATIRIYTAAGALVRTLEHENPDSDQESWDLKNASGEEIAPGLYMWDVEAGDVGSIAGKMMIMK